MADLAVALKVFAKRNRQIFHHYYYIVQREEKIYGKLAPDGGKGIAELSKDKLKVTRGRGEGFGKGHLQRP